MSPFYWSQGWRQWWWQLELQGVQSSGQIVTTTKPTPSFFTGRITFLLPNQQCQNAEEKSACKFHSAGSIQNCRNQSVKNQHSYFCFWLFFSSSPSSSHSRWGLSPNWKPLSIWSRNFYRLDDCALPVALPTVLSHKMANIISTSNWRDPWKNRIYWYIFFSAHHSAVFCFQCSIYWWKGSVRF